MDSKPIFCLVKTDCGSYIFLNLETQLALADFGGSCKAELACRPAAGTGLLPTGPNNFYKAKGRPPARPACPQRPLGAGQPKITYRDAFDTPNRTDAHCFCEFKAGALSTNPSGCFVSQL